MTIRINFILAILIVLSINNVSQTQNVTTPCPYFYEGTVLRISVEMWCYARLVDEPILNDPIGYTALAVTASQQLYATRPFQGDLVRIGQEANANDVVIVADEMPFINRLVAVGDSLFITGAEKIYHYDEITDEITVIVDDLPFDTGMWTGGITADDTHVYVGISAPCDNCLFDDDERGVVLRFDHDGNERTVIARGLRYPLALALMDNRLWVSDVPRSGLEFAIVDEVNRPNIVYSYSSLFDEINIVELNDDQVPHFGYPHCIGINNVPDPDLNNDVDCTTMTMPYMTLETDSQPISLVPYPQTGLTELAGSLFIAQSGSSTRADIHGFTVIALFPDGYTHSDRFFVKRFSDQVSEIRTDQDGNVVNDDDQRRAIMTLFPNDFSIMSRNLYDYEGMIRHSNDQINLLNTIGAGVYPRHIMGMTVDERGIIYVSLQGGRIFTLTPRDNLVSD